MDNSNPNQPVFDQDNALLELVILVRRYGREVIKNWKLIAIVVPLFVGLNVVLNLFHKTTYEAKLTFMVNEDEGSKLSGISSVLDDIGFGLGTANSEYNLEKIVELMRSKRIIYSSLLDKDTIDGEYDYLANHLIRVYDIQSELEKKGIETPIWFTHDNLETFTRTEYLLLRFTYGMVLGGIESDPLLSSEILDLPAIIEMQVVTIDENLSRSLVLSIYEKLSSFYIEKTTEKQREAYLLVKTETDSLRQALGGLEYELASFEDQNLGLITKRSQLTKDRLERDVLLLSEIYATAVANQEVAKFSLQKKTPFIQSIDLPLDPLQNNEATTGSAVTRGLLMGIILSLLFLIGRLFFRDVMASIPKEE